MRARRAMLPGRPSVHNSFARCHHRRVRAIIFDFFGTLTDPAAETHRKASFGGTAAALGIPLEVFWTAMAETFPERIVGRYGDTRRTLLAIARRCGLEPD